MKKELNGSELAEFIKERQAKSVRGLRQQWKVVPRLAIVRTNPAPVVDSYMKMKKAYGEDVLVDVEVHDIPQSEATELIAKLNSDENIHGIIVQIPLPDKTQTDEILNAVASEKDVDGLANNSAHIPATPMAIDWLLAGYNIELQGRNIVVVGNGRLVGKPLAKLWRDSGLNVTVVDRKTEDLAGTILAADILVCATGAPGIIKSDMVKPEVIVVDAGVATDKNGLVGDVDLSVRELPSVTITPQKGGVGPLTVCALFENVITAARKTSEVAA